jgi:RNA polymerase sigma-70 factor (ECF subfamily)
MSTTITSTVLLEELVAGQEQAWRRLCERHEPMLLRLARRAGLHEEDARDVVQEVLTAFLEGFRAGKYDRERGRLRQWLCGIAANKIHEARRRPGRREVQPADGSSSTDFLGRVPDEQELTDLYEEEWERAVLTECLRRVKLEFDAKTFQAFQSYALEGREPEKVAAELGIARETVYVHKSRVLARLKELQKEVSDIW